MFRNSSTPGVGEFASVKPHPMPVPSILLLLFLAANTHAEQPAATANGQVADQETAATFRAESDLALVRFQVIAKMDTHVDDLRADEIELREDGIPQRITVFGGGKLYPRKTGIDVHLLFDCSESTRRAKVLNPRVFSDSLLDEFPNLRIAMWGFSTTPVDSPSGKKMLRPVLRRFAGPTRDSVQLTNAVDAVNAMQPGSTPLYRVLVGLLDSLTPASDSVPMLVVISDGMSVADAAKPEDAVKAARRAGISISPALVNAQYTITDRYGHPNDGVLGGLPRLAPAQAAFRDLGQATGGFDFVFEGKPPEDLLDRVLKRLAGQIRFEYVAGYSPSRIAGKGTHKVQVVLKDRKRGQVIGGERDVER